MYLAEAIDVNAPCTPPRQQRRKTFQLSYFTTFSSPGIIGRFIGSETAAATFEH